MFSLVGGTLGLFSVVNTDGLGIRPCIRNAVFFRDDFPLLPPLGSFCFRDRGWRRSVHRCLSPLDWVASLLVVYTRADSSDDP